MGTCGNYGKCGKRISMHRKLTEYRAVIFDLDGTLYSQPKLRFLVACALLKYYLLHPFQIKELYVLFRYRQVRERWESVSAFPERSGKPREGLEREQYCRTGLLTGASAEEVERLVRRWMHEYPLSLLSGCRDRKLISILSLLKQKGILTAVYSDYPVEDKLAALGVSADFVFSSQDPEIDCMKPGPKAMRAILHELRISEGEALMIGDRYAKDGLSAKNTGMDFIILKKSIPARSPLYRRLIP